MKREQAVVILEAEGLSYIYEDSKIAALKDVNLQIRSGEKVAVMGSNGSGKSTFFRCCNGLYKPSGGRLYFAGEEIAYTRKSLTALRSQVGIVFQDPDHQLFLADVYQELSFGLMNLGMERAVAARKVEEVMAELGITSFKDQPTHGLSGGQKKQVSIGDILVMEPEMMIMDEPFAALDQKHIKMVEGIIQKLSEKGITVVMSSHDIDYAYQWADRIVIFHEGRIIGDGSSEEVCGNEELLQQAGLAPPIVRRLFHQLCQKGILEPGLQVPKSIIELELEIERSK